MKNTAIILISLVTFAACNKEVNQREPPVTQKAPERDFSLGHFILQCKSCCTLFAADAAIGLFCGNAGKEAFALSIAVMLLIMIFILFQKTLVILWTAHTYLKPQIAEIPGQK